MSDSFHYSNEFQIVRTQHLWKYKEFDRSLTSKSGNNHDHLEQVRHYILKNSFQEPNIISCDLQTSLSLQKPIVSGWPSMASRNENHLHPVM